MESAVPVKILQKSENLIDRVSTHFTRSLYHRIHWEDRLIGIKGARGTGKTTLLLQYLRNSKLPLRKKLYLSLDDLHFTTHSLIETAEEFINSGGELLALDEVHRYSNWGQEIKNLNDFYPDLKVVFTGSSILDLGKSGGDLGRRVMMYELPGLSFRESLELVHGIDVPRMSLAQILEQSDSIRGQFPSDFKPLPPFREYLRSGFYPFVLDSPATYGYRLEQLVNLVIEYDMAGLPGFDIRNARKLLQLLSIISLQVPFVPNLSKLAEKSKIHRNTLNGYLHHLSDARLVHLLYPEGHSVALLQKPEKLYLNNTNLIYALAPENANIGNIRETFFLSQLSTMHRVNSSTKADFIIDNKYTFEIGGRTKGKSQVAGLENAYVVIDNIDFPVGGKLPLWLFGLLY